jgi:lysophospholipase L1-like esterase
MANSTRPARFLALGDSYTIGEGVDPPDGWPVRLAALLRAEGVDVAEPEIIARTGWTTGELDAAITVADPTGSFDLVSLLIGVNNQYRGRALDEYRAEFAALLGRSVGFAGGAPSRAFVLSIPDWGVTPFAEGLDRPRIAVEVDAFNAINRSSARDAGAHYVDTSAISRDAATDPSLTASDGLHPSAKLYQKWAELALPVALAALSGYFDRGPGGAIQVAESGPGNPTS